MLNEIKQICNYSIEQNHNNKLYNALYLSFDKKDELEIKMENRNLAIDILLDEKEESEWVNRYQEIGEGIISPKVHSMNIVGKVFNGYDNLYKEIIDFLEKNTQSKNIYLDTILSDDPNLSNVENFESKIKKISSKVSLAKNIIGIDGRIGPGTCVIVGRNNWEYFDVIKNRFNGLGLYIILDDNISPDKIIVCRSNRKNQSGILLLQDTNNSIYFLKETNDWDKQYCWFRIN